MCPLQSTRRVVLEKVPLLLLSAVIGLVALLILRGARQTKLVGKVPFPLRAAHAVVSYVSYIEKMIWPTEFSPHYVHPNLPGGTPADFLDVGGSSNPQKTLAALRILLKNRQLKAVLVNIFGGITRCDDIAQGILMAREQLNVAVPMVIRLIGTNEEKGRDMPQKAGMLVACRMTDAIQAAVRRARGGLQP